MRYTSCLLDILLVLYSNIIKKEQKNREESER